MTYKLALPLVLAASLPALCLAQPSMNRVTFTHVKPDMLTEWVDLQKNEVVPALKKAGQKGRITVATNMAGRGTDIKLGKGIADMGGLQVVATEPATSYRVDRQLFGRAARQGDPGSAQAFVSAEDELLRRHLPAGGLKVLLAAPNASLASTAFALSQRRAQKLAGKQRLAVMHSDAWLDEALSFAGDGG